MSQVNLIISPARTQKLGGVFFAPAQDIITGHLGFLKDKHNIIKIIIRKETLQTALNTKAQSYMTFHSQINYIYIRQGPVLTWGTQEKQRTQAGVEMKMTVHQLTFNINAQSFVIKCRYLYLFQILFRWSWFRDGGEGKVCQ